MTFYIIRHRATGEFMPELRRTRGYSHWNPSKVNTLEHLKDKVLDVPRLFSSRKKAHNAIVQWNAMPNARWSITTTHLGEQDESVDIKPDDRSKDDLEIVEISLVVREQQ